MMAPVEIMLERETANDETALVVAVHVQSGEPVKKDDLLFDMENSKATQELVAPVSGVLTHQIKTGDTVEFGVCLAWITPLAEPATTGSLLPAASATEALQVLEPATHGPSPAGPPPPVESDGPRQMPLLSRAAEALCLQLGLDPAAFSMPMVTAADVRSLADPGRRTAAPPRPAPEAGARRPGNGSPVNGRKRAEIRALSEGAGQTMLSVVGVTVGHVQLGRAQGHFLTDRITDLVIYEASRLLRGYPNLNAAYSDGSVVHHPCVHAGMAIDGGGQLVVYGIENADRLNLPELSAAMANAVERYVEGTLSAAELSRASFTVTDLSASELDFVFPLLPSGQSCIVGITRSTAHGFRLDLGFDHRVTEGREAARFLEELRGRLRSFDSGHRAEEPVPCAFCERSAAEVIRVGKDKGLMRIVGHDGRDVLCCASCWNGW